MDCYHCGEDCLNDNIAIEEKVFCCNGCKIVFEILNTNNLTDYYSLNQSPGIKINLKKKHYFDFLDLSEFQEKFTLFTNESILKTEFYIPQIHCNSCIWLLENLPKLNTSFIEVHVNFNTKKVQFTVDKGFTLKDISIFLTQLGYTPDFNTKPNSTSNSNKSLIYKVGIAGFCFGNIMLLTFPEYLGLNEGYDEFRDLFLWISFFLSLPVTFYSGSDYLRNAMYGIRNKVFNMDLPIAIGLLVLFVRSTMELFYFTGQAYFDSLAGLIFFLLIGKWFQERTFSSLSFERDYKSFFPIAVQKIVEDQVIITAIEDLNVGDLIEIRNDELIPADAILMKGKAKLDYSFVTGETQAEYSEIGSKVFAGGKQKGSSIKVQLIRQTNNSYLTGLWNSMHKSAEIEENSLNRTSRLISKYFTIFILLLSLATVLYWLINDSSLIWNSVTAVLIIACPCALALSIPFTYGNALKYLSKRKLFFRKSDVIDKMSDITDIVFDKTGTLTNEDEVSVERKTEFRQSLLNIVKAATINSTHPISQAIASSIEENEKVQIESFEEITGKGIRFSVGVNHYLLGSVIFINPKETFEKNLVLVSCNNKIVGTFKVNQSYRPGLGKIISQLAKKFEIHVLSGDTDEERTILRAEYGIEKAYFNQSPQDKLDYIQNLRRQKKKVLMLGDGLNDAGALSESDVGIAISNKLHSFTPASDAILDSTAFHKLPDFIRFSHYCKRIVIASFGISFLYNIIGLSIAVQGILAPVLAAILMPLSSISVVLFTTVFISITARVKLK